MSNESTYNIAVSGSRYYNDFVKIYNTIREEVSKTDLKPVLIHGGCRGADTLAENCFREIVDDPEVIVYKANWGKYGRKAGPRRNAKIVENADVLLAFPLPQSKGTYNTIHLARNANVPVHIINN